MSRDISSTSRRDSLRRGRIWGGIRCALLVPVMIPASSWAQNAGPNSSDHDQETIAQLVEQIKQLQQQDHDLLERIKVLEGKQPAASPGTETDASSPTLAPQSAEQSPPPSATPPMPPDWPEMRKLKWHGFGEVDYKVLNQRKPELGTYGFVPGSAGNFYTGDFGLFLTARLSEKTSVLSEIVFEEHDAQSYRVDMRR